MNYANSQGGQLLGPITYLPLFFLNNCSVKIRHNNKLKTNLETLSVIQDLSQVPPSIRKHQATYCHCHWRRPLRVYHATRRDIRRQRSRGSMTVELWFTMVKSTRFSNPVHLPLQMYRYVQLCIKPSTSMYIKFLTFNFKTILYLK